jgi:predicted kinase
MSRHLLATGKSVIYDNASHTRRNRDRCRRVAAQSGAAFRIVWMDVPVEVARMRQLANRGHPVRKDVPDASFREIVAQFEPPLDEAEVVRFQPGMTIEDVVQQIRASDP